MDTMDRVSLRRESPDQRSAVRAVNEAAFGRSDEAGRVDPLQNGGAMARALKSPFPADAFMALELVPGTLDGVHGTVRPDAFGL